MTKDCLMLLFYVALAITTIAVGATIQVQGNQLVSVYFLVHGVVNLVSVCCISVRACFGWRPRHGQVRVPAKLGLILICFELTFGVKALFFGSWDFEQTRIIWLFLFATIVWTSSLAHVVVSVYESILHIGNIFRELGSCSMTAHRLQVDVAADRETLRDILTIIQSVKLHGIAPYSAPAAPSVPEPDRASDIV